MPARKSLVAIKEEIRQLHIKLMELEELYRTHLYLETMSSSPTYQYCYSTSNFTIRGEDQNVDDWLRAIAIHMSRRRPGHGGGFCDAIIITTPYRVTSEAEKSGWINYQAGRLTKKIRVVKPLVEKPKYKRGSSTKLNQLNCTAFHIVID